ncbi:hypothetical protein DENSPDRAFT_932366 [Dentipellis sp. KUC8613]|nr:hypothetical protein DENSPDRAFT_932366 [Dentipellis sp. KUC8613]
MNYLPTELLLSICESLSLTDLYNLRCTDKTRCAVVTPITFRTLRVTSTLKSARGFLHLVQAKNVNPYVQEVAFIDAYVDPEDPYRNDIVNPPSPELIDEETTTALALAFSLLNHLPALSSLTFMFFGTFAEEGNNADPDQLFEPSSVLRTQRAILRAVASTSHALCLKTLSILNLVTISDPVFDDDKFRSLFRSLEHYSISTLSYWSTMLLGPDNFDTLLTNFWSHTMQHRLIPPPGLASPLTSLTIHSDRQAGILPVFDFSQLTYPHLASVSLKYIVFNDSTGVVDFLIRHKSTLRSLELRTCMLTMLHWRPGNRPNPSWAQVYTRLADELTELTELQVDAVPDPVRPAPITNGLSYGMLNPDHGPRTIPIISLSGRGSIPGTEGDQEALDRFRDVVGVRRDAAMRVADE